MRSVRYPAIIVLIIISLTGCGKIEKLPPRPSIAFKSFEVFDSTDILGNKVKGGRLHFYFEDGDGDLGLASPNTILSKDSTNLFFFLYRKKGDSFVPADDNDPLKPSPYRIPFMTRAGQNKILKGDIAVTFLYLFYDPADTIKYQFFLKDRAQHLSNRDSTCMIVLTENHICNGQ